MNIAEIASRLGDQHGVSKGKARAIISSMLEPITDAAKRGEEVSLTGFGKFKPTDRAAREGRDPRTGEPLTIGASRKIRFTPSKALKERLNG
jgi:DNA-binding protein HU-beta